MSSREMQQVFDTYLQLVNPTMADVDKPDSFTILIFLNRAQERYIQENFLSKGQVRENIEYIQRRSDILRNIIARKEGTDSGMPITSTYESDNGISLDLPTNYLYYLKSFSLISRPTFQAGMKKWVINRVITHDELDKVVHTADNEPILRKPCILFEENNKLILYRDSQTDVYNTSYIYLRKPLVLTLDSVPSTGQTNTCELDDSTHQDIVELAVKMFLEEYKYKLSTTAQPTKQ